jgi:hypothetical protein
MSNRRKFLAGLGALASGSAAAIGTGAFTSVEADRTVNVAVADDASAYLSLDDIDSSPNSEYVDTSSEEIVLNLNSTNSGGSGFNANAETRIDDLIQVANQGTQTINVWVTLDAESSDTFDNDTLYFYPGDATDTALNDGEGGSDGDDVLALTSGESASLGVLVDLGDVSEVEETPTATFHADVQEGPGGDSDQVDDSGGSFATVSNDGTGDFDTQEGDVEGQTVTDNPLQAAINNASGSTIVLKNTDEPIDIPEPLTVPADKDGLELRGLDGKPTIEYTGGYPDSPESPFANEGAVTISAADVTLENLRFEITGPGTSGDNSLKITGGSPLVQITNVGTEMYNVDLSIEGPFDGPPGFVAFDVPADKGAGGAVFEDILVEDNSEFAPNGNAFLSTSELFRDFDFNPRSSGGSNVSRTAVIRDSEFRNGIPLDGHPASNQEMTIENNIFTDEGASPEAIQPSPGGGDITISGNTFEYTVSGSNEKIKFTALPDTFNGENVADIPLAEAVGDANTQIDGSGGTEDAAVLIVGVDGGPFSNDTYDSS